MELSPEGSRFYLVKQTRNQKIHRTGDRPVARTAVIRLKPFELNRH
jgi:hypothetical protein